MGGVEVDELVEQPVQGDVEGLPLRAGDGDLAGAQLAGEPVGVGEEVGAGGGAHAAGSFWASRVSSARCQVHSGRSAGPSRGSMWSRASMARPRCCSSVPSASAGSATAEMVGRPAAVSRIWPARAAQAGRSGVSWSSATAAAAARWVAARVEKVAGGGHGGCSLPGAVRWVERVRAGRGWVRPWARGPGCGRRGRTCR